MRELILILAAVLLVAAAVLGFVLLRRRALEDADDTAFDAPTTDHPPRRGFAAVRSQKDFEPPRRGPSVRPNADAPASPPFGDPHDAPQSHSDAARIERRSDTANAPVEPPSPETAADAGATDVEADTVAEPEATPSASTAQPASPPSQSATSEPNAPVEEGSAPSGDADDTPPPVANAPEAGPTAPPDAVQPSAPGPSLSGNVPSPPDAANDTGPRTFAPPPMVNVTINTESTSSVTADAGGQDAVGGPPPEDREPPRKRGPQPDFGSTFRVYKGGGQDEAAEAYGVQYCCFDFQTKDGVTLRGRWYCETVELDRDAWPSAVVCLHNFAQNERDFAHFAARATKQLKRPVITFSQRGRGRSETTPRAEHYANPTYRDDTIALLHTIFAYAIATNRPEAECYRRYTWLGTGMGGLVTLWAAAEHDGLDLMAGVILNDVGPEIDPRGLARIARRTGDDITGHLVGIDPVEDVAHALPWLRDVYRGVSERDDRAFLKRVAPRLLRLNSNGRWAADFDFKIADQFLRDQRVIGFARGELMADQDARRWEQWGHLGALPTLVLHGDESDILSERTVEKMIRARPTAQTRTFGGLGHAPDLDHEPVWDSVAKFLRRW